VALRGGFWFVVVRGWLARGGGLARGKWPVVSLLAVIAVSLAVDYWWLGHFRAGYPLDIDESRYLELGLKLSDSLAHGGPVAFWHAWAGQHEFGPLLPLVTVPVYAVLGQSLLNGLATQLVFFVLLVVSAYGIGSRLSSPAGGALVALVAATTPAVIDFTRTYQFALTDAAVLAAATYALLASEALTRRRWSLTWGLLLGLLILARTMAIAFLPAQLLSAAWLIMARPGPRRLQLRNLGLAAGVAALVAATWLVNSWQTVLHYLFNFGYGAQSSHFSSSGSRLTLGYWTREAGASVREDLYLPLAALLALSLAIAAIAWLLRHRRDESLTGVRIGARRWVASDCAIVLLVLLEGYLVIASSRNEGIGFRVPLLAELVALTVAALLRVPWRIPRRILVCALIAVSGLNLVMKADVTSSLSGYNTATIPSLGAVPVLLGQGYIQGYVLGSLEARSVSATQPLPVSQRGWLPAYASIVMKILGLARQGGYAPEVALATDEPLLNANDLTLAARLHHRRDLSVRLLPGPPGPASLTAYERLLTSGGMTPKVVVTVTHVGVSYFALTGLRDVDQGLLEEASAAVGFTCGAGIELPDGRVAVVSWRGPGHTSAAAPTSCSPRVNGVVPAASASAVKVDTPVIALFDLPMRIGSLGRAFTLIEARSRHQVPGAVKLFSESTLIFQPARALPGGTLLTATIAAGATSATGVALKRREQWSFETR